MDKNNFTSLSVAINYYNRKGYTEDFKAVANGFDALYSKKSYKPSDLVIVKDLRFDANTDPSDESELFVIEAKDGTKGTLVMSYSYDHYQNVEMIQKLER